MKVEIFEISSKEDKIYVELLEQYKTNCELQALLRYSCYLHGECLWKMQKLES